MIRITVDLISAIDGRRQELARMDIANDGEGGVTRGSYDGVSYIGRTTEALDRAAPSKRGRVENYPREAYHVWNLVHAMLGKMGYTKFKA